MKFDLERCQFNIFGSSRYKHKLLTDGMKRTLVQEALNTGSQAEFFERLLHNYREIKLAEKMNEPNAFDIIRYGIDVNKKPVPIYRWMVQTEVKHSSDLTLEEEMLNFVYWLNPKKVKEYSRN